MSVSATRLHARFRFGFRVRLSLVFFAVFVSAAAVLLAVEYGVVSTLFDSAIASSFSEFSSDTVMPTGTVVPTGTVPPTGTAGPGTPALDASSDYTITIVTDTQLATREDVLGGLLFWSALSLVGFSLLATGMAWWMTGGPVGRIRDVTAVAQRISERDLGERLSLSGPDDEIKTLGDTFDTMLDRLESAFRSQTEFIANASHELRTPLATARVALEVPLLSQPMTDPVRTGIERAIRANRRSEQIVTALLSLARAGGQAVSQPTAVSLAHCITAEFDSLADEARQAEVTLVSSIDPSLRVRGDAVLIGVMVRNLVVNAIRYNQPQGTVTVTCLATEDSLDFVVTNTGPVVTDDVHQLVTPFHRGSSSRLAGTRGSGSGLGLAIVRSIAEAHHAELVLAPQPSGGMTVRVAFPASRRLEA